MPAGVKGTIGVRSIGCRNRCANALGNYDLIGRPRLDRCREQQEYDQGADFDSKPIPPRAPLIGATFHHG